jgi:hypothetical protein
LSWANINTPSGRRRPSREDLKILIKTTSMFFLPLCSVVVRATEVISTLRTHELAMVAGQPVPAVGANLAVVIDGRLGGRGIVGLLIL